MAGELADERDLAATPAHDLHRRKVEWVRDGHRGPVPSNVAWIESLQPDERARYDGQVRRKPTRTLSGVAIVAIMTSPARCPHGRCTYCPGGVEYGTPQSYTGEEPSAMRGAQFGYDARRITEHRISTLDTIGHPTSKVEAIVMGGTFTSRPVSYQEGVFRGVFDGLNGRSAESLEQAHLFNETAAHRCVSLTVETRPDWCDQRTIPFLLRSGVTRVEIGVECLRDEVLTDIGRAHGVASVREATQAAKDAGLKVCYHLMLGLPGMDESRDIADFRQLFDSPQYRPDMVKIYPTLVLAGTQLYEEWRAGRYQPYDTATAVRALAAIKSHVPPWVRIQRIQRDIPARLIAAGVREGNVRELARDALRTAGGCCRCLRCREVGRRASPPPEEFELQETRYDASGATEVFLAYEEPRTDTVAAFLRLRLPTEGSDGTLGSPVIRELKTLGPEVAVGAAARPGASYQHRGFGRRLLDRADEIVQQEGFARVLVTSAVGTRPYYRRLGYERSGAHMAKPIFR